MNRDIVWTTQFKKDYKLALKRHLDIELLDNIIRSLSRGETLPKKNRDHGIDRELGRAQRMPYSAGLAYGVSHQMMMSWCSHWPVLVYTVICLENKLRQIGIYRGILNEKISYICTRQRGNSRGSKALSDALC